MVSSTTSTAIMDKSVFSTPVYQPPSKNNPYPDTPQPPPALGPHVRLYNKKPSELPAHPSFTSPDATDGVQRPDISTYAAAVLAEAEAFMTSYLPRTFKVKSKDKTSPPSTAPVELLSHDIPSADIPHEVRTTGVGGVAENWFARTSVHENTAKPGTASWEEFDAGLRLDHSVHERDYTPDVRDAHQMLSWESELSQLNGRVGDWEDVQAEIREMVHHIPPPLNNRVFPVLIITARRREQLIVVQMPVETKGLVGAKYEGDGKVTRGQYVSVEFAQLVEEGRQVKWQMATASDAKGNLPMWAQKLGVPSAVIKDVGLFIDWTAKRRKSSS